MKRFAAVLMSLLLSLSVVASPAYGCCCEAPAPPVVEEPEGEGYPVSPLDDMPDSKLDMN